MAAVEPVRLTRRKADALGLLLDGLTDAENCSALGIGMRTERELVRRLIRKYGVTRRRHLHLAAREFLGVPRRPDAAPVWRRIGA